MDLKTFSSKGGKTRMKRLSAARRREISSYGAKVRWAAVRGEQKPQLASAKCPMCNGSGHVSPSMIDAHP